MASQGRGGRWWRQLVLPLLEAESGLYRPEVFLSRLSEALATDGAAPFSVLLLDGRPARGRRLRAASVASAVRALVATARQEDVPARLGRRRFALLMPGLAESGAARLRDAVDFDLRLATDAGGDRWSVNYLTYPVQRRDLEGLAVRRWQSATPRAGLAHPPAA